MPFVESVEQTAAGFVCHLRREDGWTYRTEAVTTPEHARLAAGTWMRWYDSLNNGGSGDSSIYYILAVPDTWAGPMPGAHRYSGLRVKIGRARNVRQRLANLRTGTSADLVVHTLEPGSAEVEAVRHREFASDRRQGEWFVCSPRLQKHILETWYRNNALPLEHQFEVIRLQERIDALLRVQQIIGGAADLVNPSLEESWSGRSVLLDLVYSGSRISLDRPLRGPWSGRGASEL